MDTAFFPWKDHIWQSTVIGRLSYFYSRQTKKNIWMRAFFYDFTQSPLLDRRPLQETVKVVQLFFGERLLDLVKGKRDLRERNRRKIFRKKSTLEIIEDF